MNLKELRKAKRLTRAELAKLSGVNMRQIQRIENNESKIDNVTLKNACALARALDVTAEQLLDVKAETVVRGDLIDHETFDSVQAALKKNAENKKEGETV